MKLAAHRLTVLFALVAALWLGGCRESRPAAARDRALRYLATQVGEPHHSWSYLAPYLGRRFGVQITLASGRELGRAPGADGEEPPTLAPFRRLFEPGAAVGVEEIAALESPIDRMLAAALHCRSIALPGNWIAVLDRASVRGGYALTHAALAAQWTLENGCASFIDLGPLRARQVDALVALLETRDALARDPNASDIWIEALAVLHYLGARDRVEDGWLDAMLALQRPDGGWPEHPRSQRSSPHTTAFALWVLLEALQPDARRAPMIPPPRGAPSRT